MAHFDDNARTGLHALALGALIIGVPVLVVQLVDMWQTVSVTTDANLLHIFRNGYLLPMEGPQLTCDTTTRMERIGLAAVASVPAGLCCGLLTLPLRNRALPWAVGRWSAFMVFLFLAWCALTTPACSATVVHGGVRITERATLLGAIALPWTAIENTLNVNGATIVSEPMVAERTQVLLERDGARTPIATARANGAAVEAAVEYLQRRLHP
ncbi:MAG: hypothetical protein JNL05_13885 [Flavobacteriales bacterium]|nr:hypothetical protein [Flavobacteriales bacterium]